MHWRRWLFDAVVIIRFPELGMDAIAYKDETEDSTEFTKFWILLKFARMMYHICCLRAEITDVM